MKTSSRKAKGRALQNWVVEKLQHYFNHCLEQGDVKGAIMGETGSDIKMSPKAKAIIPYKFECKNQEKFKGIYTAYEQVDLNDDTGESILVIKSNRKEPLAIMNADMLLKLIKNTDTAKREIKNLINYSELMSRLP